MTAVVASNRKKKTTMNPYAKLKIFAMCFMLSRLQHVIMCAYIYVYVCVGVRQFSTKLSTKFAYENLITGKMKRFSRKM